MAFCLAEDWDGSGGTDDLSVADGIMCSPDKIRVIEDELGG